MNIGYVAFISFTLYSEINLYSFHCLCIVFTTVTIYNHYAIVYHKDMLCNFLMSATLTGVFLHYTLLRYIMGWMSNKDGVVYYSACCDFQNV